MSINLEPTEQTTEDQGDTESGYMPSPEILEAAAATKAAEIALRRTRQGLDETKKRMGME